MSRTRKWTPTPRQRLVLHLLATRAMSAEGIDRSGFGIAASTARSIIMSLAYRGLVDVAGWESGERGRERRTYRLTTAGAALEATLVSDDEGDEL